MAHRRIGQILVDLGFITDEQLELLVDEQHEHPGQLLGKVAIDMGLINDEQLAQALAEQLSLQSRRLSDITIKKDVLAMVTEPMAQMYRIIPIEFDGDTLTRRHVRPAEPERAGRAADVPGLQHPRAW